jgi:cell division septation protein DedD
LRRIEESEEREITLGVGKLVGLFFGLVICCALCFAVGYGLGRSGAKAPALTTEVQAAPTAQAAKAVANQPSGAPIRNDCKAGENCQPTGVPASQDLSFYKAVEQKEASAHLTLPAAPTAQATKPAPAPPVPAPAPINSQAVTAGIMVQVAAVSRREDAEVLQDALRRKQYPVIITTAPSDRLFHVQIGPFGDAKEAEATRSRLQADGYSPILKR